jgi:hypothetical protein
MASKSIKYFVIPVPPMGRRNPEDLWYELSKIWIPAFAGMTMYIN